MVTSFQKIGKAVLVIGIVAFLALNFFGMPHSSMAMEVDGSMTMSNCPFMSGQAVVCNMNPLEHIAAWQTMFTTTLPQNGSDLLALLLAALAFAFVWTRLLWPRPKRDPQPVFSIILRRENYLPPSLLQELLSSGILNPKVF